MRHIPVPHPYGRLRRPPGPPFGRPKSLQAISSNSRGFAPEPRLAPNPSSIKKPTLRWAFYWMARLERFELPTARFVAEYSIQLSYRRIFRF